MDSGTVWTAIGAGGTVLGVMMAALFAALGNVSRAISAARTEAADHSMRLHKRIDDLSEHIDQRYVRTDTHDAVVARIDAQIATIERSLACGRNNGRRDLS